MSRDQGPGLIEKRRSTRGGKETTDLTRIRATENRLADSGRRQIDGFDRRDTAVIAR